MSCKVLRDPNTQVSRGVGFVQLSTPEEATKAISEMNTKLVSPPSPTRSPNRPSKEGTEQKGLH